MVSISAAGWPSGKEFSVTTATLSRRAPYRRRGRISPVGDIPGATRVLSVAIYDRVEAMDYAGAGRLAAGLLVFSFGVVLAMHWLGPAGTALPGRTARR